MCESLARRVVEAVGMDNEVERCSRHHRLGTMVKGTHRTADSVAAPWCLRQVQSLHKEHKTKAGRHKSTWHKEQTKVPTIPSIQLLDCIERGFEATGKIKTMVARVATAVRRLPKVKNSAMNLHIVPIFCRCFTLTLWGSRQFCENVWLYRVGVLGLNQ